MAAKIYRRNDVHLEVVLHVGSQPALVLAHGETVLGRLLSAEVLDALVVRRDLRVLSGLLSEIGLALDFDPLPAEIGFGRLVLDVPAELAWAPWEEMLPPLVDRRIVRAVHCRPAVYDRPVVTPLRALEITTGEASLERWFSDVLGYAMQLFKGIVPVVTAAALPDDADRMLERVGWPGADILHIAPGVLVPSAPRDTRPGSPGWLERLARLARARLVVLDSASWEEATFLREVGDLLARRGGPAVVVPLADDRLGAFYERIIHDVPIDLAASALRNPTVIVGEGREEAVRLSTAAERLVGLGRELDLGPRSREAYTDLAVRWERLEFEESEGRGLYPMDDLLGRMRSAYVDEEPPQTSGVVETQQHVNASLHDESGPLDQRAGRPLSPGSRVHLRIAVGPVDEATRPSSARPLLIEPELFAAERGLWCEVGVTGIGWEVADDALQHLFVPFSDPSEPCWFAVDPIDEGAPALRYTLFHNGHVLQSFKLAAIVGETDAATDEALGEALDLPATSIGGRRWYSRLEFSTVATLDQARHRMPRTLAIVANEHAGQHVLTFKTAGRIDVRLLGDVDVHVAEVRKVLTELTFSGTNATNYRFGTRADPNGGDFDWFTEEVMPKLATAGANLYEALIPMRMRSGLPPLGGPPDTIQVANILRDRVIPWAALYQGKYDENERLTPDGTPVEHGVCTALISDDEDAFTWACGEHRSCLLHTDQVAARAGRGEPPLLADTVACPGRLWGLRHLIDVPPQQATEGQPPPASVDTITLDGRATAVLAYSEELVRAQAHVEAIRSLLDGRSDVVTQTTTRRSQILRHLDDAELAIVYLFCTTNAGLANPLPPTLFFSDGNGLVPLASADMADRVWSRHPLVLLNGCGTVGFSPRAVSQFITSFVDDRTAAAVVGTEVAVPDVLAAEVGKLFLERFADGRSAGEALLAARHVLMRRLNPLGLGYTLYGTSELHLEPQRRRR